VGYGEPLRQEYRDLWIVTLDDDGRCTAFEEWPFAPLESDTDRLAALRANVLEVQAAERRRIASALHDDPIQVLTVAVMRLDLLGDTIDDPAVTTKVQEARAAVRDGIDRLRSMLFDLHPPSLEREGLVTALDEYTRELFSGGEVAVEMTADLDAAPALAVSSAVFRVAREAIANVHKHAGAKLLDIRVRAVRHGVEIRIADDGRGFTPSDGHDLFHRGLDFGAELARSGGGWWSLSSAPGMGTTVEFWLPDA
jgi:signal transduction histidine kinase